jgi:hypothetical protein
MPSDQGAATMQTSVPGTDARFTAEELRAIQTLARRLGFPAQPRHAAGRLDRHEIALVSPALGEPVYSLIKDRQGRYTLQSADDRVLRGADRLDTLIDFFGEDPRILDARDRAPECWGERSARARP